MRALHHRAERTRHKALAAEDALRKINFGDSALVLADGSHRAGLLTRNSRFDDCVIGAGRDALSALDAFGGINLRSAVRNRYRVFRAIVDAGSRETSTAVGCRDNPRVRTPAAGGRTYRKRRRLSLELVILVNLTHFAVNNLI